MFLLCTACVRHGGFVPVYSSWRLRVHLDVSLRMRSFVSSGTVRQQPLVELTDFVMNLILCRIYCVGESKKGFGCSLQTELRCCVFIIFTFCSQVRQNVNNYVYLYCFSNSDNTQGKNSKHKTKSFKNISYIFDPFPIFLHARLIEAHS